MLEFLLNELKEFCISLFLGIPLFMLFAMILLLGM